MLKLIFIDVGRLSAEKTLNIYEKTPALAGVIPSSRGLGFYDSARGYIALINIISELCAIPGILSECNSSTGEKANLSPKERELGDGLIREKPDFALERGEYGKPKFTSLPIHFSISHRGDTVVILLSDEGEVGVDLEGVIDSEKASGIESRYLSSIYPENGKITDIEVLFAFLNTNGEIEEIEFVEYDSEPISDEKPLEYNEYDNENLHIAKISPSYDVTSRWTALEAVLKLSGGGFADFPRVRELMERTRISSFAVKYREREYRISLACAKDK